MNLSQMVQIIKVIKLMEMFGFRVTRNQIASNIKSVSRSTAYRRVSQMESIGLLSLVDRGDYTIVEITDTGHAFNNSMKELPL